MMLRLENQHEDSSRTLTFNTGHLVFTYEVLYDDQTNQIAHLSKEGAWILESDGSKWTDLVIIEGGS